MMRAIFVPLALTGALTLALAEPAWAQGRPGGGRPAPSQQQRAGRVNVQMLVVHATDSEQGIDPRLQSYASSFRYFKYKGYRLLSTQDADLAVDADASFSIEGGRRVRVTLLSRDEANARVRVEMSGGEGKLLDTTVKINRDGTFIVGGPKYKDGILILPLRASY